MYLRLMTALVLCSLSMQGQISRQWAATYNGEGDFNDRYTCVTTDQSGNILFAGSATVNEGDRDYLIVKCDAVGNLLWTKLYGSSGLGADEVLAITTDSLGYIYVTGYSKFDYLTMKLDINGDTVWTRLYDFNGEYDQANSITVDQGGNVYVTGQSDQDVTVLSNDDYATIMYSPNGALQWVTRFNGPGNAIDRSEKIVADDSGNVYVTGRSDNGLNDDYVTIKYNLVGAQQWIRYDDRGGRDRPTALAIDSAANIYLTGRSSNGTNDDYWTLKINSSGGLVWQATYDYVDDDRAWGLVIDALGNVFITGQSDGDVTANFNYDYATVAYNASGGQIWAQRYAGAAGLYDIANAICVSNGYVYVTGNSNMGAALTPLNNIVTVSYAVGNGVQNGIATYSASPNNDDGGLAITGTQGGCVAAGYTEDANLRLNAIGLGYSSSCTQQWLQSYNGHGDNNDNVHSVAIGFSNDVYAAGYSVKKGENRNLAVAKFNSSGGFVCAATIGGTSLGSKDDGQGVFFDNAGNAMVAGYVTDKGTAGNVVWTEINGICDTSWTRSYDGPAHNSDKIYDMTNDASGNFYVTGRSDADASANVNDDCLTMKMGPTGNLLWTKTYNSGGLNEDRGVAVRSSSSGNVYVTGKSFNGVDYDIFVIKYNSTGVQQWVQVFNGGVGDDVPRDMALDPQENIYITGSTEETTDSVFDFITLKYDATGGLQWYRFYNGVGGGNDNAVGIAIDWQHSAVITGQSDVDSTSAENLDFTTIKYDSTGTLAWTKNFDGITHADDAGDDVQMNSVCHSYITGHTNRGTTLQPNYDVITMVLDINGDTLWTDLYNGTSDSSDVPNVLYIYGLDFYVAGSSVEANQMRNMLVIKYSGGFADVNDPAGQLNAVTVVPNPFTDQLTIVTERDGEIFQMMNSLGEVIFETTLHQGQNIVAIPPMSSGVYLFQVIGDVSISSGKLFRTE